jgi:hypothetical protein
MRPVGPCSVFAVFNSASTSWLCCITSIISRSVVRAMSVAIALGRQQEPDDGGTVVFYDRFERLVLLLGAPDVRDADLGQAITPVGALGKQAPRPRYRAGDAA